MRRFGQISDLSSVDDQVTEYQQSIQSSVSTYVQQAGAQGASYVNSLGVSSTTALAVANGVSSIIALAQSGYDPSSQADNQKIVNAVSGGLSLIPGVGPILGAVVQGMWLVGNAISCPVEKFFSSIFGTPLPPQCGGSVCRSSGNFTAASVLGGQPFPSHVVQSGSFSLFALAALANNQAAAGNCKPFMPAGQIVDACVGIWNQVYGPPAVSVYSPPISTIPGSDLVPTWSNVSNASTGDADPNLFFAFQPVSSIPIDSGGPPFLAPPPGRDLTGINLFPNSSARVVTVNVGPMTTVGKAAAVSKSVQSVAVLTVLGGLTAVAWPFFNRAR